MIWAWNNLISMVQENYETEENQDDAIVFGAYMTTPISELRKQIIQERGQIKKLIVYQSEPLVESHNIHPTKIIDALREVDEVWDFDYENTLLLLKHGINAKYKPPVYTQSLKQINNQENPEIDVLFYGSFSDRRAKLIRSFHDGFVCKNKEEIKIFQNFNFIWSWNLSYDLLNQYIGKSKIILSLHPYDGESRQQTVRMFYPLINDKVVISEKSSINYFGDSIHEFDDIQHLGEILISLLDFDQWKTKPKNFNNHFLNLQTRSNTAIFYDIENNEGWQNQFLTQVHSLQIKGIYDKADYIHFNSKEQLPLHFYKVNRYTRGIDVNTEIDNFKFVNSNYKIIKVSNNSIMEV